MKKLILIFVLLFTFSNVNAKENKYPKEITEVLEVFINCLNNNDEDIYSVVDSNNEKLINDIRNQIDDISVSYDIKYIRSKGEDYYRIKTTFSASGEHWSTSGFSSWYDIKLIDGSYKITDTNLFNRVGLEYISTVVIIGFTIAGVIILSPFIVMLIKSKRRNNINNNVIYLSNKNRPL